jgi:peptidyl-tRNA hydrolase
MIPEDNLPALIVGLGNPDKKFLPTRHNIGFWFIESLADNLRVRFNDNLKKGFKKHLMSQKKLISSYLSP